MKANGKPMPRRPIDQEYLATLNAAVPLDTWQAICKRAADDALAVPASQPKRVKVKHTRQSGGNEHHALRQL